MDCLDSQLIATFRHYIIARNLGGIDDGIGCYSIGNPAPPNTPTYYDFLYEADGTITTLAVPGTVPYCGYVGNEETGVYNVTPRTITLNGEGTIVGTYTNAAKVPVGFIQKKDARMSSSATSPRELA